MPRGGGRRGADRHDGAQALGRRRAQDILFETSLESEIILWHPYEGYEAIMHPRALIARLVEPL